MINIERQVYNLVKKYDTCNPYELIKDLNIHLNICELPARVRGCYTKVLGKKFIAINENLSDIAQKIVVCHEIGHSELHSLESFSCLLIGSNIQKYRLEHEANLFALHLLSYSSDFDLKHLHKFLETTRLSPNEVHLLLKDLATYDFI